MGGASATIDSVMVLEPALPVVRRATKDDVTAMAAQLARTFFDDPVASHIFRNPARREAGLRAFFGTQMRADYLPFGGCYTTEGYSGSAIWAPAGKPLQTGARRAPRPAARAALRGLQPPDHAAPVDVHRDQASPSAALVPGHAGHRRGAAGQGSGCAHCCARSSSTATPRASPATSSRPRSAMCPSTGVTGSRSSRSCRSPTTGRRSGPCGGSPRRRGLRAGRHGGAASTGAGGRGAFRGRAGFRWGGCPRAWRGRR